jgi:hypothetical protein
MPGGPGRTRDGVAARQGNGPDVPERAQIREGEEADPHPAQPEPRYRKARISDRQREAARLHKILEDTGIKLDCVASDILGASGRAMLDALVQGTTDPEVLAELTKGKLRKKIPALREAPVGRFDSEHALIVSQILPHRPSGRGDRPAVGRDRAAGRPFRRAA